MVSFLYLMACGIVSIAAYRATGWALEHVFGKRLKVSFTGSDGVKRSTVVRYKQGDDLDELLGQIKNSRK